MLNTLKNFPGQLSRLPSAGREISTGPKFGDDLRMGSKGRYGSFHLWINVWVRCKTMLCDPSLIRAIPKRSVVSQTQ